MKRLSHVLIGIGALAAGPRAARADICFQTPAVLPGLSGVPIWKAPGFVRTELNEPRWAAAPQTWFDSDPTGTDGLYRIMVDPAYTELSVSFQAPTDLGSPSNGDRVFFAFTTNGLTATLAKGISVSVNNSGATDPTDASIVQEYDYNGVTWSTPFGTPAWLVAPSVWRNNLQHDAAWGINFKINLAAAGLASTTAFKIFFGLFKQDEGNTANSVSLSTPPPNGNALVPSSLIIADPTQWATASAIDAGCPDGIALDGSQIASDAVDLGSPAPNEVNTSSGAINHFFARPSIPAALSAGLFAGEFQGRFHIANWGSIADPAAAWTPLPGDDPSGAGKWVGNGVSPAPNPSTLELTCSANTATTTCGIPTPTVAHAHQCMYVELREAPTQTIPIKTATAFTNMWFKPLSNFSAPAEISVKGLKAKLFHDDKPRDVYVYVYPKNLPPHGNEPIYLPTEKMAATRRFAETPPTVFAQVNNRVEAAAQDAKPKAALAKPSMLAKPAPGKPGVAAVAAAAAAKAGGTGKPPAQLRQLPLPSTGIGDLDLNPRQALGAVWPSYDVHVYYDSGKTITIGGKTTKQLVPMFPFTSFHSHDGPLYGFSHSFKLDSGAELQELRPNVFLLHIPSEGVAHVVTSITANETPIEHGGPPPGNCPKPPPVEINGHCGCRVPGQSGSNDGGPLALFAAAAVGLAFARRRRARRG